MDWKLLLEIAGFVVGIVGFVYGVHENRLRRRLERLAKSSVWATLNACEKARGKYGNIKVIHERGRLICIAPESRDTDTIHRDVDCERQIAEYFKDTATTFEELHERCVTNVLEQYDNVDEAQVAVWHHNKRILEPWTVPIFTRLIERQPNKK